MTLGSAITAVATTLMMLAGCTGPGEDTADEGNEAGQERETSGGNSQQDAADHPDYSAWDRIEPADYQGFPWRPLLRYTDGQRTKTYLTFRPDGTWIGSDGCNGQFGRYTLWPNGDITANAGGQTLIWCPGVNVNLALEASDDVTIDGRRLTLYDGSTVVLVLTTQGPAACCPDLR